MTKTTNKKLKEFEKKFGDRAFWTKGDKGDVRNAFKDFIIYQDILDFIESAIKEAREAERERVIEGLIDEVEEKHRWSTTFIGDSKTPSRNKKIAHETNDSYRNRMVNWLRKELSQ